MRTQLGFTVGLGCAYCLRAPPILLIVSQPARFIPVSRTDRVPDTEEPIVALLSSAQGVPGEHVGLCDVLSLPMRLCEITVAVEMMYTLVSARILFQLCVGWSSSVTSYV